MKFVFAPVMVTFTVVPAVPVTGETALRTGVIAGSSRL
jgi:hypothetical protein